MTKKHHVIFILLLLSSILISTIQFLPILKNELKYKTELIKKNCNDSGTENQDNEEEKDENQDEDFFDSFITEFSSCIILPYFTNKHVTKNSDCISLFKKVNSPPPKI